jgi:anhydro-N-acetylmuramic acid kinase
VAVVHHELILCGGGARNATLVGQLKRYLSYDDRFAGVRVRDISEFGISDAAKECVSFAMLAAARVDGVPANLRRVTGATRRTFLGQIYEPGSGR